MAMMRQLRDDDREPTQPPFDEPGPDLLPENRAVTFADSDGMRLRPRRSPNR
jgi:hypothetical protein